MVFSCNHPAVVMLDLGSSWKFSRKDKDRVRRENTTLLLWGLTCWKQNNVSWQNLLNFFTASDFCLKAYTSQVVSQRSINLFNRRFLKDDIVCLYFHLIYLKDRETTLIFHSPNAYNSQNWTRTNTGSWSSTWVCLAGDGGLGIWDHLLSPRIQFSRMLGLGMEPGLEPIHFYLGCGHINC